MRAARGRASAGHLGSGRLAVQSGLDQVGAMPHAVLRDDDEVCAVVLASCQAPFRLDGASRVRRA